MTRRLAAVAALVSLAAATLLVVATAMGTFPRGVATVCLVLLVLAAAGRSVISTGRSRAAWGAAAGALTVALAWWFASEGVEWSAVGVVAFAVTATAAAKPALSVHLRLPAAAPPRHAVVVWNPKSGGGKALQVNLADEARARGIEPIELKTGDDLGELVRQAVARGADALAAAGGDGTQSVVATFAAAHDLPFACIPAGTRNHFALDLGVDRDDVVGALDAFVDGGEKRVDLGQAGDRTFVNNVSLGLYAEAVQRQGYRGAKLRTLLSTAPQVVGPAEDRAHELRWKGPGGADEAGAVAILVSNNVYRLARLIGPGTRPRMDAGCLGVTVLAGPAGDRRGTPSASLQWQAREFIVESDAQIPVGIDGEALIMESPLVIRSRPGALRVRISAKHPGTSPSYNAPTGLGDAIVRLARVAAGRAVVPDQVR